MCPSTKVEKLSVPHYHYPRWIPSHLTLKPCQYLLTKSPCLRSSCICAHSLQWRLSNSLQPLGLYPPGSSVHGISQARILEWVAILFSRGSSRPRDQTQVYCIAGLFFIKCVHAKSLESFLTLCNPMDHSPPGSSVHGIIQARILEWVAISFSRVSSWLRSPTNVSSISCIGKWIIYCCATWETHGNVLRSRKNPI